MEFFFILNLRVKKKEGEKERGGMEERWEEDDEDIKRKISKCF